MCVGKGRNDPQRGGICGTTCVVPPHHLDCVCVCVGASSWWCSLFFWAGRCYSRSPEKRPSPPPPFHYPLFSCDDDHARRRRRVGWLTFDGWLAGSLVWTIQTTHNPPLGCARRDGKATTTTMNNEPRSTDEEGELLQSILRGWRPLIDTPPLQIPSPPPPRGRSSLLLLLLLLVLMMDVLPKLVNTHPGLTRC